MTELTAAEKAITKSNGDYGGNMTNKLTQERVTYWAMRAFLMAGGDEFSFHTLDRSLPEKTAEYRAWSNSAVEDDPATAALAAKDALITEARELLTQAACVCADRASGGRMVTSPNAALAITQRISDLLQRLRGEAG